MASVLVINGPNLNLLGKREPHLYGSTTLVQIIQMLETEAKALGHHLEHFQSNAEHELIDRIHQAREQGIAYIIINPGAYTHTSIALRDALLGVAIPFIEVHLSNVFARESFRQHSYLSDVAIGVISGLGAQGYLYALKAINQRLKEN
jgi:3-dehydroquinate dehydratase II